MVDIAQLVSASDCGSEGRGFESHYPPQKRRDILWMSLFFFWVIIEFEEAVSTAGRANNMPVACCLGLEENPWMADGIP